MSQGEILPQSANENYLNLENFQLSVCGKLWDTAQTRQGWEHQPGKVFICLITKLGQGGGYRGGPAHCWPSPPLFQSLPSWPVMWRAPSQVWMLLLGGPSQDWVPSKQAGWQQKMPHMQPEKRKGAHSAALWVWCGSEAPCAARQTGTVVRKDSLPSTYAEAQPYFLYCQNVRTSWHSSKSEIWQLALEWAKNAQAEQLSWNTRSQGDPASRKTLQACRELRSD